MQADLFWVYGCPNGDTVLPMLRWIKRAQPFWNTSVREGQPRHMIAVGHEEGWAEVWNLLGRWLGPNFDHANHGHGWDDIHPASATRQIASIQVPMTLPCNIALGSRLLPWTLATSHPCSLPGSCMEALIIHRTASPCAAVCRVEQIAASASSQAKTL
jgi:hypothetical protein